MDEILFVDACVRPGSRTRALADCFLSLRGRPVRRLLLEQADLQPLNGFSLARRDALIAAEDWNDPLFRYARQFAAAEEIVIAAPYWDLSFPALLKVYLEQVCVCGLTFVYTDSGVPKGLCRAKRLTYLTTAGGQLNPVFGFDSIKALCTGLFGIPRVDLYAAEGLDLSGADPEGILAEAMDRIRLAESGR